MHASGPDAGVWNSCLTIGEANGFGVGRSEDADRATPIRCQVALDVFCAVKVQAPAFLAKSIRKELWSDRLGELPLDDDILARRGCIAQASDLQLGASPGPIESRPCFSFRKTHSLCIWRLIETQHP